MFSLLFMAVLTAQAEVTHLAVEKLNGTETTRALAQLGKIVMGFDDICLYDNAGTNLGCTPMAQIGKIVLYKEGTTTLDDVESNLQIVLNPTSENLFVHGIAGEQTIRIYSMQGHLIQSAGSMNGEANINVSGVPSGTYLLQVGAQVVKLLIRDK